ncbi:hypothetical protein SDC9_92532 [bioreactor metagenome]|uniref:Uncharacterized protein n=1 Tax=bioreactor metagenome TaxID=1076179 RepID=A0A644ZXY7_9ZZZZ
MIGSPIYSFVVNFLQQVKPKGFFAFLFFRISAISVFGMRVNPFLYEKQAQYRCQHHCHDERGSQRQGNGNGQVMDKFADCAFQYYHRHEGGNDRQRSCKNRYDKVGCAPPRGSPSANALV